MRLFFGAVFLLAISSGLLRAQTGDVATSGSTVETLVCIRHGEKPLAGMGEINAKGLNRALALPKVLAVKFGAPQFIFAPDPAKQIQDKGITYSYVRPLATIEPTAVYFGLPINTQYGDTDIAGLQSELAQPQYRNAVVFIAWEHLQLHNFVQNELAAFHSDLGELKPWPGKDFDTILVVKITRQGGNATAALTVDHEGLDGVSAAFPGATP